MFVEHTESNDIKKYDIGLSDDGYCYYYYYYKSAVLIINMTLYSSNISTAYFEYCSSLYHYQT